MNREIPTIQCKKCYRGQVWITERQVETGTTTKKGEWITCGCCGGKWERCIECTIEELKKEL
jgi:hypothetical protein